MPSPLDQYPVGLGNLYQFAQLPGIETEAGGDLNLRVEPDLGLAAALAYVHMQGFARAALVGVEEEAEASVAEHNRHRRILCTG